jgi:hypothetical protein
MGPLLDRGIPKDRISGLQAKVASGAVFEAKHLYSGSSPHRVGDFGLISYRVEHAGEDFEAQVLLVA